MRENEASGVPAEWVSPVACLVKRWPHHSASGGYDQLAKALAGITVVRKNGQSLAFRAARFLWPKTPWADPTLLDYQWGDLLAEGSLLGRALWNRPAIVHALYGDEQLHLLLRARKYLPCPLVATFHLPSYRAKERMEKRQALLSTAIDAAIVVARCQLADFQGWLGTQKVFYVPHGIDTETFSPPPSFQPAERVHLLSVGAHMRDWDAIHRVIDECAARRWPVQFDIVSEGRTRDRLTGCANMRFHWEVPETELLALYRQADVLLLPVTDSTANNSLLESLACGTPVISTAVGGIPDYLNETSGWLFPLNETEGILRLIGDICQHREIALAKRADARARAEQFAWPVIVKQLRDIYSKLPRK